MSSTRLNVTPPDFTLPPHSLASVVQWREGERHWKGGVQWETVCGDADSTYDECVVIGSTSGAVTGSPVPFPEPPVKSFTGTRQNYGATPFTIYAEVDCSAVGFYDDSTEWAEQLFQRSEAKELEKIFSSGVVGGQALAQFPHLTADTPVNDVEDGGTVVKLQLAATVVTGAASCIEVALGLLESAFADCYNGRGVVHVPNELIPLMDRAYLLEREGDTLRTTNGNIVVAGTGYSGASPAGATAVDVRWIYMTPQIFGYRSDIRVFPRETTLNRSVDTVKAVAERTYLLGYDCCLVAVPVSLTCG